MAVNRSAPAARAALLGLALLGALLGCGTLTQGTSGPFHDLARARAELVRGRSTRSDVERILGRPLGSGTALLPTQSGAAREVWLYQDMELRLEVGRSQAARIPVLGREQFVLVFFDGDAFDGLMCWPAEMTGEYGPGGGS